MIRSAIKTVGEPLTGSTVNLETDALEDTTPDAASDQEIADAVKVMGGEDWQDWINFLRLEGVLAQGCRTVAYSYIGSRETYRIYHEGTLGRAKKHLHETANNLEAQLSLSGGGAHVAVCKALVTKASVFIPAFAPYMLALFKVMKKKNITKAVLSRCSACFPLASTMQRHLLSLTITA